MISLIILALLIGPTTADDVPTQTPSTESTIEPAKKPYDAWAALQHAREFMMRRYTTTTLPPNPTPNDSKDNFFEWRERQEERMRNLYRGNPYFDNRLEMVESRRAARKRSGVLHPQYLDGGEAIGRLVRNVPPSNGINPVVAWRIEKTKRTAEQEKAYAEIAEEEQIIAEFAEWKRENDARSERMRQHQKLQRQLEEGMDSVEVDADEISDYEGYFEQMEIPPPPNPIVYSKTMRIPRARKIRRD